MKKILLLILSIVFVFSLCACNSDTEDKPIETSNGDVENSEYVEVEVSENIVLKGTFLSEYSDAKYEGLDIGKFLGTAIVNVRPEEYRKNDIPIISGDSPNADLVLNSMFLKEEYLENFAISVSLNSTRAYTVAIMEAAPYCEEYLVKGVEQRIRSLYEQVKDYPDQLYLVDNAVVTQMGNFLVLVICDNAQDVCKAIDEVMTNTDLTTLKSVPYMTEEERIAIENEALEKEISDLSTDIGEVVVTSVEENKND